MAEIKFVRMKITDPDELQSKVDLYFAYIDALKPEVVQSGRQAIARKVPPTLAGLARVLGISTWTLAKYLRGEVEFPESVSAEDQEKIMQILTAARTKIEDIIVTGGIIGRYDNTVVRQHMSLFGYGRSMDESGEEANHKVTVIIQGATDAQATDWSR